MSNHNKTMGTILRWTHILVGFLIGVFVYTPTRDNETFVLLMQAGVVPAVALTGLWMWQQARIRRLYRRARTSPRREAVRTDRSRRRRRPGAPGSFDSYLT